MWFLSFFFFLHWVFTAAWAFSSHSKWGCSALQRGLLLAVAPLAAGPWACGRQPLCCMGLGVPQPVGSSWARDPTRVHGIGRWILFYCTIREVPWWDFKLILTFKTIALKYLSGDFPSGSAAQILCSQGRGLSLIPGWGTRSHMPQVRIHVLQSRPNTVK